MSESNAWLLRLTEKEHIAIGEKELLHIITDPDLYRIPQATKYCQHIVNWRNMALPVMNVTGMLYNQDIGISKIIGIIAYQNQHMPRIQYAAIDLSTIPARISVNDNQACELSETVSHWKPYTIACFERDNKVVPVIDLASIFTTH